MMPENHDKRHDLDLDAEAQYQKKLTAAGRLPGARSFSSSGPMNERKGIGWATHTAAAAVAARFRWLAAPHEAAPRHPPARNLFGARLAPTGFPTTVREEYFRKKQPPSDIASKNHVYSKKVQ